MNFRSIAQMTDQLLRWSHELPRGIEVVAGIPRSGLLAANILSLYLNVPLTDLEGLLHGRCYPSGGRRKLLQKAAGSLIPDNDYLSTPRRVLVLDDSVLSGKAMRAARETVGSGRLPHDISYGAVYVSPRHRDVVDHACELLNAPRVFEWNLFHIGLLSEFFVSLEGVLHEPLAASLDARGYAAQLDSTPPWVVPSREVGWIVSSRPESDRPVIEGWLQRHDITWRNLLLVGTSYAEVPAAAAMFARAEAYRATDALLFLEHSLRQAVELARLADRPVLCTRTMQLIEPGTVPLQRSDVPKELHPARFALFMEELTSRTKQLARRVLPRAAQDALRRGTSR